MNIQNAERRHITEKGFNFNTVRIELDGTVRYIADATVVVPDMPAALAEDADAKAKTDYQKAVDAVLNAESKRFGKAHRFDTSDDAVISAIKNGNVMKDVALIKLRLFLSQVHFKLNDDVLAMLLNSAQIELKERMITKGETYNVNGEEGIYSKDDIKQQIVAINFDSSMGDADIVAMLREANV